MGNKTAVEWLIDKHFGGIENVTPDFKKHIEQAKEMEKEQHKQIWNDSLEEVLKKLESLKQYYNSNQRRR
jgi:hypothetical protein